MEIGIPAQFQQSGTHSKITSVPPLEKLVGNTNTFTVLFEITSVWIRSCFMNVYLLVTKLKRYVSKEVCSKHTKCFKLL